MMTREQRAKQFQPFDAMKGLQEALRDREERHSRVEKREISEETREKIGLTLSRISKYSSVLIECYLNFHDVTLRGTVSEINTLYKYLCLGDTRIYFDDIYSVELVDIAPDGIRRAR